LTFPLFWCIIDVEQQRNLLEKGKPVFIEIDPSLPQPLFEQVAMQIKFAIAAGTVRSNEMIPSVRDLSRQLAINPNTVVRAYRLLQDEEVLIPRRGMGLAVTEHSQAECQKQRREFFKRQFQTFLDEAARSRISKEELDEILNSEPRPGGRD
jgi:GntR family transcriptional regulator